MQRYQFTARWVRGKENLDNDALARAPVDIATPADEMTEEIPSSATRVALINSIQESDATTVDPMFEKIKTTAKDDNKMSELRETIIRSFPNEKCNLPLSLRTFWNKRSHNGYRPTSHIQMPVYPRSRRRNRPKSGFPTASPPTAFYRLTRLTTRPNRYPK
jgi:hypothetical protein